MPEGKPGVRCICGHKHLLAVYESYNPDFRYTTIVRNHCPACDCTEFTAAVEDG